MLAKAVLLRGTPHQFDTLGGTAAEALAVDGRGTVFTTPGMRAYQEGLHDGPAAA